MFHYLPFSSLRLSYACASSNWAIKSSVNGLPPGRHQAIIWTYADLLWIGPLVTYLSEVWIKRQHFSLTKINLDMSSKTWRSLCLGFYEFYELLSANSLIMCYCRACQTRSIVFAKVFSVLSINMVIFHARPPSASCMYMWVNNGAAFTAIFLLVIWHGWIMTSIDFCKM